MKSKIFNCPDWVSFMLIVLAIVVPLLLGGCKKSENNDVSTSYTSTAGVIGLQFEKKYVLSNGGDTVTFHSNQTATENVVLGKTFTYSFSSSSVSGFSNSVVKDGTLFKIWIDTPYVPGLGTPMSECMYVCEFARNLSSYATLHDTCTLGMYLSGSYLYNNIPTLNLVADTPYAFSIQLLPL